MSRKTWAAPSLTCGRRVRSEPVPQEPERHPEPDAAERFRMLAVDALRDAAPALTRGVPELVNRFERALDSRLDRLRPGRPRRRKRTD